GRGRRLVVQHLHRPRHGQSEDDQEQNGAADDDLLLLRLLRCLEVDGLGHQEVAPLATALDEGVVSSVVVGDAVGTGEVVVLEPPLYTYALTSMTAPSDGKPRAPGPKWMSVTENSRPRAFSLPLSTVTSSRRAWRNLVTAKNLPSIVR